MKFSKETDLCDVCVSWMEEGGVEVYPEVKLVTGGPSADIVGIKDGVCTVVQAKLSLTLEVIAQAKAWKEEAHYTYVLVPDKDKWPDSQWLGVGVCKMLGIGVLAAKEDGIRIIVQSRKNQDAPVRLMDVVHDGHKAFKAGAQGKRWSPYRQTVDLLVKHVEGDPGCTVKDAVKQIKHHWSSNRVAVRKLVDLIRKGSIKELTYDLNSGVMKMFPAEVTSE